MRTCRHCAGPLPCKECTKKRQQAWVEAKRERVIEQKKAYEARYPERVKEAKRAWYERNKEIQIHRRQEQRRLNPEQFRERYRRQYAENPLPFIIRQKRRSERDKQVGGTFTDLDKCALFQIQRGLCANPFCEGDLSVTGFHADHKTPVARGGSHDPVNRQLLCPTCNHRKGTMTNEEWLSFQGKHKRA